MSSGVGPAEQLDIPWEIIPSGELDEAPHGQLQEFRQDLQASQQNELVVVTPEDFAQEPATTKAANVQLIRQMHNRVTSGGRHFYVSPDFKWLGESEESHFSVVRMAGAETSAHGVFFGLLSDEGGAWTLPIAVKPFREKPINVCADWLNNSLIAGRNQNYFAPVGFMIGGTTNYSITEIRQGAETLDNSHWRRVLMDEHNPEYDGQRALLAKVGTLIGDLHADSDLDPDHIFHGDLQFKNIVNDVAGNVFGIDWESASFYNGGASNEVLINRAAHDLRVLFASMARSEEDMGVGLLHNFDPLTQWRHFKRYVFDPYMEAYLEKSTDAAAFDRLAAVEEHIQDYILQRGLYTSLKRPRHGRLSTRRTQ
jgi:tRNA A-37 threonylcarbamoyl transferase component Bud32